MMFESSSRSKKSWNGRKMTRECIPEVRSNRRKRFRACHGSFAWGDCILTTMKKSGVPVPVHILG